MATDRDLIKKELEQEYYPAFLMLKKSIDKMASSTKKVEELRKDEQKPIQRPVQKPKETFDPEGKGLYHIHQDGFRLTDNPVSLRDIRNKYGSVKDFEGLGYRLVPHVQKTLQIPEGAALTRQSAAGAVPKGAVTQSVHQKFGKSETEQYIEVKAEKIELTDIPQLLQKFYKPFLQNTGLAIGRRHKYLRQINKKPKHHLVHKDEMSAPKDPPAPKMSAPKMSAPKMSSPKMSGPEMKAPVKMASPKAAPKVKIPKPPMSIVSVTSAAPAQKDEPQMAPTRSPKMGSRMTGLRQVSRAMGMMNRMNRVPRPLTSMGNMSKAELDQEFIPKFYKKEGKLDTEHSEKIVQERTDKVADMIKEELKVEFKPKFKLKVTKGKEEKAEDKKDK